MALPDPRGMDNFRLLAPAATHHDPATCEDVGCRAYAGGFALTFPADDPESEIRAGYVRRNVTDRRFAELAVREGEVVVVAWNDVPSELIDLVEFQGLPDAVAFVFPPGERCFVEHTVQTGRPPILEHASGYLYAHGGARFTDRRINIRSVQPTEWFGRFNENLERTGRLREREVD
jgi:hypothetical protein